MNKQSKPKGGSAIALDTLVSLISGLGTVKAKNYSNTYGFTQIDAAQLTFAYRGDWIARKVVDIPAFDATREWRAWQADEKQITAIEEEEKRLGLQAKVKRAITRARLYGGAGLIIGGGGRSEEPLDPARIKKGGIEYVHMLSCISLTAGELERDIKSPYFDLPKIYTLASRLGASADIHPSRVVRFIGAECPEEAPGVSAAGWGDSVLQAIDSAVKNAGLSIEGIAELVHEAKLDVIKIPNLMANLSHADYKNRLIERFQLMATAKSLVGVTLLDAEESWDRVEVNFANLPDIIKVYLLVASGAADIPATRMLSQAPVGLNATGDSDTRNYYDRIRVSQTTEVTPAMSVLDECLVYSALGNRPPEVFYDWRPLWQMSDDEKSKVAKNKADAFKVDVDTGLLPEDALRQGRQNQLIEDGTYPGFEQAVAEAESEEEAEAGAEEAEAATIEAGAVEGALGPEPAKEGLNGAQITSMQEIVLAVGNKEMPPETAIQMLLISFPTIEEEIIRAMVKPMETFEPKPKPMALPFGAAPGERPTITPPKQLRGRKPPTEEPGLTEESVVDAHVREFVRTILAADRMRADDVKPRTLYVRRDVVNAGELTKWAREQGFENILDDMHVTIVYCPKPVDWMKAGEPSMFGEKDGKLNIPAGGPRVVEPLGDEGAIVLHIASSILQWRHCDILRTTEGEATYPEYQPHVTISKDPGAKILAGLDKVVPYSGPIVLGPEIFEETK